MTFRACVRRAVVLIDRDWMRVLLHKFALHSTGTCIMTVRACVHVFIANYVVHSSRAFKHQQAVFEPPVYTSAMTI